MTDGPVLLQIQEQEQPTNPMLTLDDVVVHFTQWISEHPSIAAQVGEEVGLTVYLAGVVHGATIAHRMLMGERQASGAGIEEE